MIKVQKKDSKIVQIVGHLMVDDYAGYKALLGNEGVIELGCLAHARRKFFDLHQAAGRAGPNF